METEPVLLLATGWTPTQGCFLQFKAHKEVIGGKDEKIRLIFFFFFLHSHPPLLPAWPHSHMLAKYHFTEEPSRSPLAPAFVEVVVQSDFHIVHVRVRMMHMHFICGCFMFNSHLLHNWVSEWIFSTLLEAWGLEDQLLPISAQCCCDMTALAARDRWEDQMLHCVLHNVFLCSLCLCCCWP